MGIAALTLDQSITGYDTSNGKPYTVEDCGTGEKFIDYMSALGQTKCPYGFLAKDGIINYNGVIFQCDYANNAITLGNMYEKEKVLRIALPSGGSLHVNVDNIDQLSNAVGMFTPEDLNAIMRAIHEYNHCTRKRFEIEEEKSESIEDVAEESETPDGEEEPEIEENALITQLKAYQTMNNRFVLEK